MSDMQTLSAEKRSVFGKGENRRLRVKSLVPGIYYDANGTNVAVQMPALPLSKVYSRTGRTNVFNLEITDGGTKTVHPVFVWDAQYHPVKGHFTHVDFYGVKLDEDIKITVPIEFVGTSKGVKLGGTLETYHETLTLSAKPEKMPRKITVDISNMDINAIMHVADLKLPEGVTAVYSNNFAVVAVVSVQEVAEEAL